MTINKNTLKKLTTHFAAVFSLTLCLAFAGTDNSGMLEDNVATVGSQFIAAEASEEAKEEKDIQFPFTFDTTMA